LGIPIKPVFLNWILVQPGSRLPIEFDGARLVQRDQFSKALDKLIDSISVPDLIRVMSRESLTKISRLLEEETRENKKVCDIGGANAIELPSVPTVPERVPTDEEKYGLKVQSSVPAPVIPVNGDPQSGRMCTKCSAELTHKEAAYCRYNFQKFSRQYLCRKCQ
jgi:hypothetical protein